MKILEELTGKAPVRLEDVAGLDVACPCGRRHRLSLEALVNRRGCAEEAGAFLAQRGFGRAWLIADQRTYEAAGRRVERACRASGIAVKASVLPAEPPPHADRDALGRLAFDLEAGGLPVIAVGSGTVTDLARFLAHRTGAPLVVVATAPSMDGYTSSVAAMLVDGVRITYPATAPRALFADPDVYAAAPAPLIAAGYAEILGKLTALADWRLSAAVNGELVCPLAEEIVADAVRPVLADPSSRERLMEALLWVGVAMQMEGSSRPASGAEHHVAHYWEMRALWEGREPYGHGVRVGVASVLVQAVYRELFHRRKESWPLWLAESGRPVHAGESEVRAWYGPVADRLLQEQAGWRSAPYGPRPLSPRDLEAAAQAVEPYLMDPDDAAAFLARAGAPRHPGELGIGLEGVKTGLAAAKELRRRFTVLHLASELGVLDEVSREVAKAFVHD